MAAASPRNPRRTKGRHRRPTIIESSNCAHWLRVGTVGIGLGAAIASGQAIASAAPDDSSNSGPAKDAADTASTAQQGPASGGTANKAGPKKPPTTKVSGQTGEKNDKNDKNTTGGSKADSGPDSSGSTATDQPAAGSSNKRAQPQIKIKPNKTSEADSPSSTPSAQSTPATKPAVKSDTGTTVNTPAPSAAVTAAEPSATVAVTAAPAAAAVSNAVFAQTTSTPVAFTSIADVLNWVGQGLEESLALAVRNTRSPKGSSAGTTTTTSAPPAATTPVTGAAARDTPDPAAVTPISPSDAVATLTAAYTGNTSVESQHEAMQFGLEPTNLVNIVLAPVINAISLLGDLAELGTSVLNRDGVGVADEIGDVTRDLIGMIPVVGQPIAAGLYHLVTPQATTAAATASVMAAAAAAPAAATTPAVGTAEWYFQGTLTWAVNRLAGWPGTPGKFVDVTNTQTDQSLDLADVQLQTLVDNAIAGSPARWVSDLLGIFGLFFQSALPNYTFTATLNAWGDFLNRIVPPFTIASGAGTFDIITPYKMMGAAVVGTATVLKDMLNGIYDPVQIEKDVVKATTGADSVDMTAIALSVGFGDGGAFSHPERAWNITLPTWTAEQVNPFTIVTYVALVGIYKRFQEMAALQNYTLSTTYDSWLYTINLGSVSSQSEYAAGTFHAVDEQGRTVDFFGVSQGGTYTSAGGGLVTINTASGGFTYTNTLPGKAFFHNATSENEAETYDTVYIPVKSADGVTYTLPFKIKIIDGTNAAPTATSTAGSADGLGVVRGTVSGSDSDGDTLKYTLVSSSVNGLSNNSAYTKNGAGNGGIVTLNQNTGAFTYASSSTAAATQSFQVQVTDGHGGSTITTVTVNNNATITPANVNTSTQEVVTGSVPVPSGDAGMFTGYTLGTPPSKGTVTSFDPLTGAFTYTRTPGLGHTTTPDDVVTVLATDANGRTVTLNMAVAPTVANTSPTVVLTTAPTVGTLSGTTQTSTGKVTYSDSDGDTAVWPSSVTTARGGTVTFAADGTFTYTSNLTTAQRHAAAKIGAAGTTYNGVPLTAYEDAFTVTVSDGYGGTAQTTVKVPIYAINSAPTISSWTVTHILVTIGTAVKVNDADGDLTSGTKPANGNPNNGNPWYTFSRSVSTFNWYGSGGVQDFSASGTGNITLTVGDGYYVVTNGVVTGTAASGSRTG